MKTIKMLNIKDVGHLCKILGTNKEELRKICEQVDVYYRKIVKIKSNGKKRTCYEPGGRLREIVDALHKFLQRVELPEYIHGGRKGHSTFDHARPHINKPVLITMDLENYFPNIKNKRVYKMFVEEQGCSPDVARYLTRLTTYKGVVPHGSPTSTDIANLVVVGLGANVKSCVFA